MLTGILRNAEIYGPETPRVQVRGQPDLTGGDPHRAPDRLQR